MSIVLSVDGLVGIVGALAEVSALALSAGGSPHAANRVTMNRTRGDRDMTLSVDSGPQGREGKLGPAGP